VARRKEARSRPPGRTLGGGGDVGARIPVLLPAPLKTPFIRKSDKFGQRTGLFIPQWEVLIRG